VGASDEVNQNEEDDEQRSQLAASRHEEKIRRKENANIEAMMKILIKRPSTRSSRTGDPPTR